MGTCQLLQVVQGGDDGGAPLLKEEKHHDGEGEVGDPGPGDAASDAVSSGPAAHGEHQVPHARVQLSVQVEQLCALHCHPVENKQRHCRFRMRGLAAGVSVEMLTSNTRAGRTLKELILYGMQKCGIFFFLFCSTSTAMAPFSYTFNKISSKSSVEPLVACFFFPRQFVCASICRFIKTINK